ncbi:cadherin-like beta sandwich domain-containing protein, partial [Brevibacillus sp. SYSU BS000544]|uniref:RCC1 domain-containing protein n=1 Tax=Brevibacillus sp. SYSU BS000544 TaxID=3416443 RepID=UPI003CE4BAFB
MWKILLSLLLCMSFLPFGQASANTTFTSVSAGNEHTVAIDSTGSVWAWGSNMNGSLGDGTTTAHLRPIKVPGLTDITAISASGNFTLALKNDGTVYAWGMNYNGQLGNGTSNNVQLVPLQIPGLDHVIAIEAGNGYSMALKDDGKVYTWGLNNNGQLGDGTTDSKSTPVQVLNISNAKKISAGHSHAMALIDDKTVYAWGDNQVGQIGNGTINARQLTPVKIGISGITSISAGGAHSLAVKEDGTVYGWGRNVIGEVGDGTTNMRALPVVINSLTGIGITSVETGTTHSLAIQNDGTVWGWGDNQFGQLGDESSTPRLTPVKMKTSKAATIISSSFVHSMIVYNDGTIWGTGRNNGGQLGIGSYSDSNKLVQVAFASTDANLSNLVLSTGQLTPPFSSNTTSYTMNVNNEVESISLTPTASSANATITVTVNSGNPINVTSGQQFGPFALNVGENQVSVKVTAEDGLQTKTYTVVITRAPINHAPVANAGSYQTTQDVAVTGTLIATDSDSDPLTYSIVSNGSLGVVNITNTATGAFTYTPNNGATG